MATLVIFKFDFKKQLFAHVMKDFTGFWTVELNYKLNMSARQHYKFMQNKKGCSTRKHRQFSDQQSLFLKFKCLRIRNICLQTRLLTSIT